LNQWLAARAEANWIFFGPLGGNKREIMNVVLSLVESAKDPKSAAFLRPLLQDRDPKIRERAQQAFFALGGGGGGNPMLR
jgi:hypothetical protein